MLTVCTWLWGNKYSDDYVRKLRDGVKRNLRQNHRFVCIADRPVTIVEESWPIPDHKLTKIKGCFARLRMFDPDWQNVFGVEQLLCLDLDLIVTGNLDTVLDRPEDFVILAGTNAVNPCPYNGSVMMLRAGTHPEVWRDFSIPAAKAIPFYDFPDDQGWIAHKIPKAAVWKAGSASGIYGFEKPGWPKGSQELPSDARIVCFPGSRDPHKFAHLNWIKQHWV